MNKLLSYYTSLFGTSGSEGDIRQGIINEIKNHARIEIDKLGNIIAFKKGEAEPAFKLMLCAHMDEVGLMVTHITEDGYLKFDMIGGIDVRVLPGKQVVIGKGKLRGVIGRIAPHLQKKEQRECACTIEELYIDIGANSKEDALRHVRIGDVVGFCSEYAEFGKGFVRTKGLDDRIGCQILTEIIQSDIPFDTYFVFSVMEEIGCIGAGLAAAEIRPDVCIVIEGTTAADISSDEDASDVCKLGGGPVISFMDGAAIYDRSLFTKAVKAANKNNIPYQVKQSVSGGNDAGRVQRTLSGVRVIAFSVPVRYLHTPYGVACLDDIEKTTALTKAMLGSFAADIIKE